MSFPTTPDQSTMSTYNQPPTWQEAYQARYGRSVAGGTGGVPTSSQVANHHPSSGQRYGRNVATSSSLSRRSNQQTTFIQPTHQIETTQTIIPAWIQELVVPDCPLTGEQQLGIDNFVAQPRDFSQMSMADRQTVYNTLPQHEQRQQEVWAQQQLNSVGVCAMGWKFTRVANGYRCYAGIGSHYVSDELLSEGRGGYYLQESHYLDYNHIEGREIWSGPWYGQGRNKFRRNPNGIVAGDYIRGQELHIVPVVGVDLDILRYSQTYDLHEGDARKLRDEARQGRGKFGRRG